MPAVSQKQRRFMAAERGRERAGKKTQTHMSDQQLTDFMSMKGHPDNSTAIGKPTEAKSKPVTPADTRLSIKHHKDSIQFNLRHAEDHDKLGASESAAGKAYNKDHADAHRAESKLHERELQQLTSMKGAPHETEKYKYLGHYATGKQKTINLPARLR